jgi:hypothetical protein
MKVPEVYASGAREWLAEAENTEGAARTQAAEMALAYALTSIAIQLTKEKK